jgi:Glycosyl transferase family 8
MDILEWAQTLNVNQKPWLLLGKGPSFGKFESIDSGKYFICTLNHVIREVKSDLAHIIDIDVIEDCENEIYSNAKTLVLPYHPHVKNKPSGKTIYNFIQEIPVLKKMEHEGRLAWCNLSTGNADIDSPVIKVKFFSAEAALNVLATCGAKTVRSLGIDGGNQYNHQFDDLRKKTLLANGHESFDKQFKGIAETVLKTGIFYAPLNVQAPIKVFVGTDYAQMAGVKVLEYSIKKYASMSVEVVPINDRKIPIPKNPENRARTGFSFSRYHIPALCGYKGKAIYLDADMQLFKDITKLWNTPMEGANVLYSEQPTERGRAPQYSVMLLNCAKLDWDVNKIIKGLDQGKFNYNDIMFHACLVPPSKKKPSLPFEWNSLEHYEASKTCLIHYTDMNTQPWISNRNKHGKIWYKCLREAVDVGFLSKEFLYGEVQAGNVSPDLPSWIGLPKPEGYKELKSKWVPPFRRFATNEKLKQTGKSSGETSDLTNTGQRNGAQINLSLFSKIKNLIIKQ